MEQSIITIYNIHLDVDSYKSTFIKGTDIGFDKDEIKKTSTEDLLTLRKSILVYLKSTKLKKRNANFMDAYQRINDELKERKETALRKENCFYGYVKVELEQKTNSSTHDSCSNEDNTKKSLLKRKTSGIEIEIPSFLNDKKQKVEVVFKKEEIEKPTFKKEINEFGKGLFDEKLDFDPSSDMDTFKALKKSNNFDVELKEIEIKGAMFNAIPEDIFFSLD